MSVKIKIGTLKKPLRFIKALMDLPLAGQFISLSLLSVSLGIGAFIVARMQDGVNLATSNPDVQTNVNTLVTEAQGDVVGLIPIMVVATTIIVIVFAAFIVGDRGW